MNRIVCSKLFNNKASLSPNPFRVILEAEVAYAHDRRAEADQTWGSLVSLGLAPAHTIMDGMIVNPRWLVVYGSESSCSMINGKAQPLSVNLGCTCRISQNDAHGDAGPPLGSGCNTCAIRTDCKRNRIGRSRFIEHLVSLVSWVHLPVGLAPRRCLARPLSTRSR